MGRSVKDPPSFSQHKQYSRWKSEVEAWKTVAVANKWIEEATVGQALALSLPSSAEEGDLRGKVMDAVPDLTGAAGYTKLIKWMDDHLGRDATCTTVDRIRDFMKYGRKEDQSIKDYIAGFDAKYNAATAKGLDKLPEAYLMWLVVENAEVSETDAKLVMAGIDLKKTTELYDQAKKSLLKYLDGPGMKQDTGAGVRLKNESTLFSKNPNWRPTPPYQPRFPIRGGGATNRGGGATFRGGGAGAMAGGFTPRTQVFVPRNPVKNGKQALCDLCGAWTHFKRECPHNPKPAMYGDQPEIEEGAPYYEDNDFAYVSQPHEEVENTEGGEEGSNNYVGSLIATLNSSSGSKKIFTLVAEIITTLHTGTQQHPGQVVLDTGCVESVCATKWLNTFIGYLHPSTRKMIKVEPSNRVFKFGGGEKRKSVGTFHIPCSIEGQNIILTVDAVEQDDLPCLLSKKSMKHAKTVIDVAKDTAVIFGKEVQLKENHAGHYVAQFEDFLYDNQECAVMVTTFANKTGKELHDDVVRMHKGLGHPSRASMERMIRACGDFTKDIDLVLNKLYETCESCLKHGKSKPTPKVSPPTAYDVNDTISIDLKIFQKKQKIILYIIDEFSRYVTAVVIPDKRGETVVKALLDKWILGTPYGPPKQLKSDNGGEFVNKSMRDLCEMYSIKHITTAAFAPWSNGGNERNHHTVDLMMEKIMAEDKSIKFEDALARAVYAKNSMLNVHGFSPSQILTGKQPRIPGACSDNTPQADNLEVTSKTVQQNLNLMQMARQAFAKVDNSNRLRTAMKVRESPLRSYTNGETVWYKFGADPGWHGPGKVIGQDNKIVFIRHGGHIISVSQNRIHKPGPGEQMVPGQTVPRQPAVAPPAPASHRAPASPPPPPMETSSDSDSSSDEAPSSSESEDSDADEDIGAASGTPQTGNSPARVNGSEQAGPASPASPGDRQSPARDTEDRQEPDENGLEPVSTPPQAGPSREIERFQFREDQVEAAEEAAGKEKEEIRRKKCDRKEEMPKKGNWILYKEKDKDVWFRAQVLGKGVKASSKIPYYNILPEFENDRGVNLDDFDWTYDSPEKVKDKNIYAGPPAKKKTPPAGARGEKRERESHGLNSPNSPKLKLRTKKQNRHVNTYLTYYSYSDQIERAEQAEKADISYVVFIPKDQWDKPFVVEAKQKEISNFRKYGAFIEVPDVGQARMTAAWIITEKLYGDVLGAKARIVVHGNQERTEEQIMSDSPTVSKSMLRLQFAIAAQMGWECVMADITSAFLQSDTIERELYVQPPKDVVEPGVIWRLKKPMYGLEDASLQWYKTLSNKLIELGCVRLTTDPATFYWRNEKDQLGGIASWHVDDMIACGEDGFYKAVLIPLMDTFTFGSTSEGKYRCLGWNVIHRHDDILVSQQDYIEAKIDFLELTNKHKHRGHEKLEPEDASKARGHIGKLRWLADQCRPDLAYSQLELSIAAHNPTWDTVKLINKMVAAVKHRDYQLRFSKLKSKKWYLTVFSDFSLKGLPDKISSAMGYVILLSEGYRFRERNGCNILSWKSCKTKRIVSSTYDGETLSLTTALEEAIFIKHQMVAMLGIGNKDILIEAFCDCGDTVAAIVANKPLPTSKNRLAALEIARVKEMKDQKVIHSVHWVPSGQQLADVLTKRGASTEPIIQTISKGKFFD